jgi:hypothetical protein
MSDQQDSKENINMQVDVGVIKSQMIDLKTQTNRIENKLDGMSMVSLAEFKKFTEYVDTTFIKRDSVKGLQAVGLAVVTALAVSVTLGIAGLLGAKF